MGLIDIEENTKLGVKRKPMHLATYMDFLYNLGGGNRGKFPLQAPFVVPQPSGNALVQANITTENGFILTTQTGNALITNQRFNT